MIPMIKTVFTKFNITFGEYFDDSNDKNSIHQIIAQFNITFSK